MIYMAQKHIYMPDKYKIQSDYQAIFKVLLISNNNKLSVSQWKGILFIFLKD